VSCIPWCSLVYHIQSKEAILTCLATLFSWIAVGGFDFSDADKPTHGTWYVATYSGCWIRDILGRTYVLTLVFLRSKLVSTATNRAAFIKSLKAFMSKYGFQGVDLDWEYPVDPKRGGAPADTANLVLLVREMRCCVWQRVWYQLDTGPRLLVSPTL
jgi:chitinase